MKNILFDLDGTIVDTSEGIINCMHYEYDKLGIKRVEDKVVKNVIGSHLKKCLVYF